MTKRREWPRGMAEIRNQAGELAMEGLRALEPLVEGESSFDRTELLRRQARAAACLQRIAWLLASIGAPLRPEDLR